VSRCYLDTNFIYAHLRARRDSTPERLKSWRTRVLSEIEDGGGVMSGLVMDELAYRLILAWLRDDGDGNPLSTYRADSREAMRATRRRLRTAWRAIDSLSLELQPTEHAVIARAKTFMAQPGLAPRDAFHAAHALIARCSLIASSDTGFDDVAGLRRIAP
jgi:predicted nucleic acid-binding protein